MTSEALSSVDENQYTDLASNPASAPGPSRQEGIVPSFPKQQVGVADYFAVLGVGEELVWKHAQKHNASADNGQGEDSTIATTTVAEEDDARLLERFYREIVDCIIVVADEASDKSSQYPATVVYAHANKNHPHHQRQMQPASIPISPSPSDVTASAVGTDVEHLELEGWKVLQQTGPMPAAPPTPSKEIPPRWSRGQVWDADLDPVQGLSGHIAELEAEQRQRIEGRKKSSTPLKDLRHKVQSTFQQRLVAFSNRSKKKFYLSFRRRAPDEFTRPAIADMALMCVQIHKATVSVEFSHGVRGSVRGAGDAESTRTGNSASIVSASTVSQGAAALLRVAEAGKQTFQSRVLKQPAVASIASQSSMDYGNPIALESLLELPAGLDEWSIPELYRELRFPNHPPSFEDQLKTVLFAPKDPDNMDTSSSGIEAIDRERPGMSPSSWRNRLNPKLVPMTRRAEISEEEQEEFIFVPILAMRRQRIGEEERFHEDSAIVEMSVSFTDETGKPILPYEEVDPFEEEDDDAGMTLLEKTSWSAVNVPRGTSRDLHSENLSAKSPLGTACILVRRNIPLGFCDAAFSTSVLDRFPYKNYKGLPLPEEELPMFCYPTGCRLLRAKFCDAPLPQYYGFVVKNERGDSIYVSCVSFMESLTQNKQRQLTRLSEKRRRVSLPHARFWTKQRRKMRRRQGIDDQSSSAGDSIMDLLDESKGSASGDDEDDSNMLLMGFEDMTTFENKTICLVSRYPYWTAFRRFLSHLHSVSGSASDLPLERYISHLLLSVPIPKPGGPSVLIPLPTFNVPMMLWSPPLKDFPLLDLPYERLVSCLDVPTIVTIVLGFLALERKVIVMSTRPSLVLDVCELLRSLLFPFDLCAPYVPRLTEPFMSCLDFPGAIFVGIHDDGSPSSLAAVVRDNMPEDSTIVDLDSGSIDCSGDRMSVLKSSWGILPPGPRSNLVSEIETLCRDAAIVPGQEPLDSLVDPAFDATMPSTPVQDTGTLAHEHKEPLDDRAIRDAFLRFFCSVLGGYERYLVVPDVDFLISGNEWFDAKGFLAAASEEKAAFLGTLVSTQLFQSFIQRRTEASDVHCLLFDECLAEFHSSPVPYGRLGGDVETIHTAESDQPQLLYSLLVDQSSTEVAQSMMTEKSFDYESKHGSDTDSSGQQVKSSVVSSDISDGIIRHSEFAKNATGDWVTLPTRSGLSMGSRFIYCIDGNPTFPDRLNPTSYLPRQPESWLVEMTTAPTPMLTRSSKEIEESDRRRKLATSYRGLPTQRRCLWQLPKLMGSHFLGAWLLCIPALVAQPSLTHEQQSKYLLRALGALRLLRSKQRIVPDEAAYRALIVACGRTKSDRRVELVKLFGLLRSDGIFPSAVTLGQYTKALAEGYSKQRSTGLADDENGNGDSMESFRTDARSGNPLKASSDPETALAALDRNIANLEDSGRRWRQKSIGDKDSPSKEDGKANEDVKGGNDRSKKKSSRPWLPVVTSWSLAPSRIDETSKGTRVPPLTPAQTRLVAMWSRTKNCGSCGYIPLEEEVQAGWDVLGGENDILGAINCPRCGGMIVPMLGYRALSTEAATAVASTQSSSLPRIPPTRTDKADVSVDFAGLPPQMRSSIEERREASYVKYISPATLRSSLERHIEEHGEAILERDRLRETDPEAFYNLWWYSARFSLPLPLPVSSKEDNQHYCAMVGWDYEVSLRGCASAAKVMTSLFENDTVEEDLPAPSAGSVTSDKQNLAADNALSLEAFGDYPLLSRFNLQGYYATVWDHADLSEILVTLVEACDKRDFRPLVECLLRANKRRREKYANALVSNNSLTSSGSNNGNSESDVATSSLALLPTRSEGNDSTSAAFAEIHTVELDCYRTALYLAKYQCTSAFHAFFPATLKPCKGYHFWCPIAPVPIFDRLLHDAIKRVRAKSSGFSPFHDVSDVALGFRSVFGHLV